MLFSIASLIVVLTAGVTAQKHKRGGPTNYSITTKTTVKNTVKKLKPDLQQNMHVILKTSNTTLELALNPSWYQTEKKYAIAKDNQIETVGTKNTVKNRKVLLVREIKKGSKTMTFRDTKNFPMWADHSRQ